MDKAVNCMCGHTKMTFKHLTKKDLPKGFLGDCCKMKAKLLTELSSKDKQCKVQRRGKTLHRELILKWVKTCPFSDGDKRVPASVAFRAFSLWLKNSKSDTKCEVSQTMFGRYLKSMCKHRRTSKGIRYDFSSLSIPKNTNDISVVKYKKSGKSESDVRQILSEAYEEACWRQRNSSLPSQEFYMYFKFGPRNQDVRNETTATLKVYVDKHGPNVISAGGGQSNLLSPLTNLADKDSLDAIDAVAEFIENSGYKICDDFEVIE